MRSGTTRTSAVGCLVGTALCLSLAGMVGVQAENKAVAAKTGEQVYRQQCAACHGVKGEGTKLYRKPLTGSQSVGQLAKFIAQSMPPGPKKCTAPDAQKVASYVSDAFYSPVAQARNKPARIELSRLTVRQYRNAVADLLGSFRAPVPTETRRGLHAVYFKSREFNGGEGKTERIDPEIRFDFGTAAPAKEQTDAHQFSIRWEGAILAPETGEYEFCVKSEHSVQFWINDPKKPLIDAAVRSGKDTEFRGSIFLLGGRTYPIRLEFRKSRIGVDDTDKVKKQPPVPASLSLEWRPPKRAAEGVPERCLVPVENSQVYVPATPFPPDDRSIGYERGTAVSKAWDEAATEAALETAAYVTAHLRELSGAANDAPERPAKLREFCRLFAERAFRRPLSPDDVKFYVDKQFGAVRDPETAVKRVVLLALKSPHFLYREIGSIKPDAYDVASRLSFGLWDSLPDAELLQAAAGGQFASRAQVQKQAERMVADPRSWAKVREFCLQWLKVDSYPDLAKNPKRFPDFNESVASDLRTAFELFLEGTVWSDKADFRQLMQSDKLLLNGRLAKIYGVNLPADAPFQWVSLDKERAGVLTHPYLLSSFAYIDNSSPIHRGVLIARNLLGRMLQPPPQAFTPLAADLHPKLTTRQRVTLQTKPAACAGCHGMINPLGFTLERFDAIGRLREIENDSPVDATGSYQARDGKLIKFGGIRDLSQFLANSDEAHSAFVEKLFQYLVKQPIRAYGTQTLAELQRSFSKNEYNIRKEVVEIVTSAALQGLPPQADARVSAR